MGERTRPRHNARVMVAVASTSTINISSVSIRYLDRRGSVLSEGRLLSRPRLGSTPNVRVGSEAEVSGGHRNVRCWGKSGHCCWSSECLLLAISGHSVIEPRRANGPGLCPSAREDGFANLGASHAGLALRGPRRRLLHGALAIQIAGKMARHAMIVVGHCQRRRRHLRATAPVSHPRLLCATVGQPEEIIREMSDEDESESRKRRTL